MVETVPVPSWTPPTPAPVSRPSSAQTNRQDAFDSALKRADSSRSSEPAEEDASIDEPEVSDEDAQAPLPSRSSVGEGTGRLRFDELLTKKGGSDREPISEASAQQANGGPAEIHADSSTHPSLTPSSAAQTPLMVESVAAMMMRLERMPEVSAGQWQFNLLDDPAGISSLQLQRAVNGSWKVSVSVLSGSDVEQEQHASELKSALELRGHTVESVQIAAVQSDDVVSAELDDA